MITYAWAMDKPKSNVIEPLKDASNDRRSSVYRIMRRVNLTWLKICSRLWLARYICWRTKKNRIASPETLTQNINISRMAEP